METTASSAAHRDLRDWLDRVEGIGLLMRIKAEVDWDEEMAAISHMVGQEQSAPALLFETIRGYPREFRALWNLLGGSVPRIALALGEPHDLDVMELIQRCKAKFGRSMPPVFVEPDEAPVNANHLRGSAVDVT
ncbi:MAG: UbiD family decarboxylase, partial [candidate division NC10 bacterium]